MFYAFQIEHMFNTVIIREQTHENHKDFLFDAPDVCQLEQVKTLFVLMTTLW